MDWPRVLFCRHNLGLLINCDDSGTIILPIVSRIHAKATKRQYDLVVEWMKPKYTCTIAQVRKRIKKMMFAAKDGR